MFGPVASFENFIFNAFDFSGRATRAEYWWVFLIRTLFFVAAVAADIIYISVAVDLSLSPFGYATFWFLSLTLIPSLSLSARRLHDAGRSSFWWLVNFVPFAGVLWFFLLMSTKSEDEDNKWGPMRNRGRKRQRKQKDGSAKHDPWQSYAVLVNAEKAASPEQIAAQREAITDYYRTKVLNARPSAG